MVNEELGIEPLKKLPSYHEIHEMMFFFQGQ